MAGTAHPLLSVAGVERASTGASRAPQPYLRQAQVHRGRLRDVHDLAIRSHDKYETVQRLQKRVENVNKSIDRQTH